MYDDLPQKAADLAASAQAIAAEVAEAIADANQVNEDYITYKADAGATIQNLTTERDLLQGRVDDLTQQLADCQAQNNPPPPPPPPLTEPLLGLSSDQSAWATDKALSEATGGHIQARRLFFQTVTDPLTIVANEPTYPVISFKPAPYSWAQIASGAADSDIKKIAANLKAMDKPLFMTIHHEPGKVALGPTKGESGTAAEFAAMQSHVCDLIKAGAPKVAYGVIMNGWMWGNLNSHFTDAQMEVWLPKALRAKLDVIGADDYTEQGGETGIVKTKNRVAWAKRVGSVKALGIGETNGYKASDLTDVFSFAKTEPLFAGSWACLWNGTTGTHVPIQQTGLVATWQSIVRSW